MAESRNSKFDLTLMITDGGDEILLEFEYSTDLFDGDRIQRMTGHFQALLAGIAADAEQRIGELSMLTAAERQQLLVEWNGAQTEVPPQCIHELFEAQVKKTPDAVAVEFSGRALTYRQLNSRANQLARYLRDRGVGPEVRVGVCLERSLDLVVGLLGILKAGGAYVPLDPAYPRERLAFMLQDSQAPLLVTQQKLREQLPAPAAQVVCLDEDWPRIGGAAADDLAPTAGPTNLAYVIYTSGSTGKPKGVTIPHRSTVNFHQWAQSVFTRAGAFRHAGFDVHLLRPIRLELFVPLSAGGRVIRSTMRWGSRLFRRTAHVR